MRTPLHTLLLAALALGGCNFSNEDLIFLAALPSADQLEAAVPAATAAAEQGLGVRRDPLTQGGASTTYQRTRAAADDYNGGLLKLLGLIDKVKTLRPSQRTADSRTWGPFGDDANRDREARLVITRAQDGAGALRYAWSIDLRRKSEAEWFSAVAGSYAPGARDDVTRGVGEVRFDGAQTRLRGFAGADDDGALQTLQIRYDTAGDPRQVQMDFHFRRESFFGTEEWRLHYDSTESLEQGGALRFDLVGDFVQTLSGKKETLTILSRWRADGAGRADITASGGDLAAPVEAGAECWDAQFLTVYGFEDPAAGIDLDDNGLKGEPAVGAPSACAFGPP